MSLFHKKLPSLVVQNGQTTSSALEARKCYSDCELISIYAPAGAGTGHFEVSPDGLVWTTLVTGQLNTVIPTPQGSECHVYDVLPATAFFRIVLDAAVGAITTFNADGQWRAS